MAGIESSPLLFDSNLARQLKADITEEIFKAIKFPNNKLLREVARPIFNLPTKRFSQLMAAFDQKIEASGSQIASNFLLSKLTDSVSSKGQEIIPRKGPVVIASNHPGTYDGLTILSQIPREDVKLIVSGIPFFKNLPNGSRYLIFATRDQQVRVDVIRKAVRHLQSGGLLLIFPSGQIDPDPSILNGAEENLQRWSQSLTVFLRKVPEARLVLAITSGVLSREFINHPLTWFFKKGHERRRIMEFMQVIKQMILNQTVSLNPRVCFSREKNEFSDEGFDISKRMDFINSQALELLKNHMKEFYPISQD